MKNWKRTVCAVLCAGMLLSPVCGVTGGIAAAAEAAGEETVSGTCGETLTWTFEQGTTLTISGTGVMNDYVSETMPWDACKEQIREIRIGSGVTRIGDRAFLGLSSLETVSLPADGTFTAIGEGAFYGCTALRRIVIPDSVTEIGAMAFSASGLLAAVIPDAVTQIVDDTFMNCSDLLAVQIGKGVTSIGEQAFCSCPRLASVILPEQVKTIGSGAFSYCNALREVCILADDCEIADSADTFSYVDESGAVRFDGVISGSKSGCAADAYAAKYSRRFAAFAEAPAVYRTDIGGADVVWQRIGAQGETIRFTGTGAMQDGAYGAAGQPPAWCADAIRNAVIGEGITAVGKAAFAGCTALESVSIPSTVTQIGDGAFYQCKGLVRLTIPAQVRSIGQEAFRDCSGLSGITILNPDCVFTADADILPSGTTVRGYSGSTAEAYARACGLPFEALESATDNAVQYSGTCGDGVQWQIDSMNTLTISGKGAVTETPWLEHASVIRQALVSEGVTGLPDEAFYGCDALVSVKLPDSLERIGTAAFWMCTALGAVTIPAGVTEIGYEVFYKCDSLPEFRVAEENTAFTAVDGILYSKDMSTLIAYPKQKKDTSFAVPEGVGTIQPAAFSENPYLTSVTLPDTAQEIQTLAFYNCLALTEITASEENDSFVSEDGVLYSRDKTTVVAYPMAKSGTSYTIPDGVTAIGAGAFAGTDLTAVTIPSGVITIDMDAFYNCTALTAVKLPDTVTGIGDHAFASCKELAEIIVPASVEAVGYYAFYACDKLETAAFLNTGCDICNDKDTLPERTVLRGYADSAAQLYAEKYGRSFEELSPEPEFILGDVNLDGTVNAEDATAVLIAAARLGTGADSGLSDVQKRAADVTGDGTVNAQDATTILRYAAAVGIGKEVSFESLR